MKTETKSNKDISQNNRRGGIDRPVMDLGHQHHLMMHRHSLFVKSKNLSLFIAFHMFSYFYYIIICSEKKKNDLSRLRGCKLRYITNGATPRKFYRISERSTRNEPIFTLGLVKCSGHPEHLTKNTLKYDLFRINRPFLRYLERFGEIWIPIWMNC